MSGGGGGGGIAGYRYYFGIHMGVSRGPIDELILVKVGDRYAWAGSVTESGSITIDAPQLFGGEKGEGGVQGNLHLMFGEPTQVASPQLEAMHGTAMPGYRRIFTAFFDGLVSMMNPYPKPWKFRIRRALQGWDGPVFYPETCVIPLTRPVYPGETERDITWYDTPHIIATTTINKALSVGDRSFDVPAPAGSVFDGVLILSYGNEYALVLGTEYSVTGTTITVLTDIFDSTDVVPWVVTYQYTGLYGSGGLAVGTSFIHAMNPAHIIYETMTNREWGRGLDRAEIDEAQWRETALQLYNEGFGLCIKWSRQEPIESFVQGILDTIGAVLFTDRKTALLKLKLIRGDYVADDLPLFDAESGLLEIREAPVAASSNLINEVHVKYHDPVTDKPRKVRVDNLAGKQATGGAVNLLSKEYIGVPIGSLAGRLAQRDLRATGIGLRRFTVVLDRRGYEIEPGGVFRIRDLARGVRDLVLRAGRIEDGTLTDGKITISAMQDVFGFPSSSYVGDEPPAWIPPRRRPCVGRSEVFEMPYFMVNRNLSPADFATVDDTQAYLGTVMEMGQPLNAAYSLAIKNGVPHSSENPPDSSYVCGI